MSKARRAASCAVVIGIAVVGCGSGSVHGRSAADSSGVVGLSSSPASSAPASLAASASTSATSAQTSPASSASDALAGTAAALAKDHWSVLPAAPIAARSGSAFAWTGRQLLIWGGDPDPTGVQFAGDGAAYDPSTKQWTKLPAAPMRARTQMASAWTGTELFVWGGDTADGFSKDGALYNPTTMTWRKLPTSPLSARAGAQAVWLDNEVIVISGTPPTQSSSQQVDTDLAAFSPATDKWTTLAPMPLVTRPVGTRRRRRRDQRPAVCVGRVAARGGQRGRFRDYLLRPRSLHLRSNAQHLDAGCCSIATHQRRVRQQLTRRHRLGALDGNEDPRSTVRLYWCGDCPGPACSLAAATYSIRARTCGRRSRSGPIDAYSPVSFVWTGSALFAFNTNARRPMDQAATSLPGQAAAWDPSTGTWTRLPAAPLYRRRRRRMGRRWVA